MSQTTEHEAGQMHPVTTSTYACSNAECQQKTDQERADRKRQMQARIDLKEKQIRMRRERADQAKGQISEQA